MDLLKRRVYFDTKKMMKDVDILFFLLLFLFLLIVLNVLMKENGVNLATRAVAMVFGVHLSARAAFRLDPEDLEPTIRTCVQLLRYGQYYRETAIPL